MKQIHFNCAGIDMGSQKIFIGLQGQEVVSFGTFTSDFKDAAKYLKQNGIVTVAMEATGVYWVCLYDILVNEGFDVWLVDGRQTKQVPGRKTDVKDCQWIQQLHSHGLLNRCFVAEGTLKELRAYERIREDHIRSSAVHINHMQKALTLMNIRLPEVLSQINGVSGLALIKAILNGERNPHTLLSLCDSRLVKNKSEKIIKALEGSYSPEGLFALQQAYDLYMVYKDMVARCDKEISKVMKAIHGDTPELKKEKRKPIRHNKPDVEDLVSYLKKIFSGKDATLLPGITDYSWLQIYVETGENLSRWPTEKHFSSWLGLSPGQANSGKVKRNKRKGSPKAGQIFRTLAQSLIQSKKIAFGAFGRRLKGRKGPQIAVKAVARKLAVQYWRLMVKGQEFCEKGIENYENVLKIQKEKWLGKLAKELNMELVYSKPDQGSTYIP